MIILDMSMELGIMHYYNYIFIWIWFKQN